MVKNTDISYRNQLLYSVFVRAYGKNGTFKDVEEGALRVIKERPLHKNYAESLEAEQTFAIMLMKKNPESGEV